MVVYPQDNKKMWTSQVAFLKNGFQFRNNISR